MMRVLLAEYLHAASWEYQHASPSLINEGQTMLACLAADFAKLTTSDPSNSLTVASCQHATANFMQSSVETFVTSLPDTQNIRQLASALAKIYHQRNCDCLLIVAPETDGILHQLLIDLRNENCHLLAADAPLVEIASDKLLTDRFCRKAGLPTIETWDLKAEGKRDRIIKESASGLYVIKPRDGVGCEGVVRVSADGLSEVSSANQIAQPWIDAASWSVGLIAGQHTTIVLPPVQQLIEWADDRPTYKGSRLPSKNNVPFAKQLEQVILDLQRALPQFLGYVGVDLVFSQSTGWMIVEINPRLCSSYAVYSQSCAGNLAEAFVGDLRPSFQHESPVEFLV